MKLGAWQFTHNDNQGLKEQIWEEGMGRRGFGSSFLMTAKAGVQKLPLLSGAVIGYFAQSLHCLVTEISHPIRVIKQELPVLFFGLWKN